MRFEVGDYRNFAQVDLRQLEINKIHGFEFVESTCIHTQQYVEKMIKENPSNRARIPCSITIRR